MAKKSRKKLAAILIVLVLALVGAYLYLSISPAVQKSFIEKPPLEGEVNEQHISWIVNEIGAYKLHPSISGEEPEIELVSEGKTYTITTKDGKPVTAAGQAKNPDIRINASGSALIKMFTSVDARQEVVNLYNAGEITIEFLKDQAALALKGYKAIYDAVQGGA